jgi:hypothetical protein
MLSIDRLRDELPHLPALARAGLVGLLVSAVADVPAHITASGHGGHGGPFDPGDVIAHVGVLVSMSLILVGVVVDGVRARRRTIRKGVE